MHVGWMELRDVRSYPELHFEPEPGINVLVGANGAGKTTVLEAVAYLSSMRSFRRTPDSSLIRMGADAAVIRGGFVKTAGETRIEVELPAAGRRRVLLNAKRPQRLSAVAFEAPVVAFLPDDLDLVKDSSGIRRRYLDDLGAHLAPGYGAAVADYEQTLKQRNALLRNAGPDVDMVTLEVWDERLATTAAALWRERQALVERLAPVLARAYRAVADDGEDLTVSLLPALGDAPGEGVGLAEALLATLLQRRRRELEQRTTTAGPHRDEILLGLSERDTRSQASQGEQRSVAVALRVAAYELLEDRHGHPPVLLLDDVFSELDLVRTAAVVDMLPKGQVFVTTTRDDEVPVAGRRWDVSNGRVR